MHFKQQSISSIVCPLQPFNIRLHFKFSSINFQTTNFSKLLVVFVTHIYDHIHPINSFTAQLHVSSLVTICPTKFICASIIPPIEFTSLDLQYLMSPISFFIHLLLFHRLQHLSNQLLPSNSSSFSFFTTNSLTILSFLSTNVP